MIYEDRCGEGEEGYIEWLHPHITANQEDLTDQTPAKPDDPLLWAFLEEYIP